MPFVTQEHREKPDINVPGDLCYVFYKELVRRWKKEPRWTTAHNLYKGIKAYTAGSFFYGPDEDHVTAIELAWQVFFIKYVMPYEDLKEKENGTI
jgi:hypothetical protein